MFKHEPKVATPLLNMLSVNHERQSSWAEQLSSCTNNVFSFLSYTDTGAHCTTFMTYGHRNISIGKELGY